MAAVSVLDSLEGGSASGMVLVLVAISLADVVFSSADELVKSGVRAWVTSSSSNK
jgi:hypothetical protein